MGSEQQSNMPSTTRGRKSKSPARSSGRSRNRSSSTPSLSAKKWAKFGKERGNKEGPDRATTTVGENVVLKLTAGNKSAESEPSAEQNIKTELAKAGAGKVVCRLCKGDHFTAKCPYKDSLAGLETAELPTDEFAPAADAPPAAPSGGGKYVPPSMRAGARGPGESMNRPGGTGSREDLPTLRVTNISEET